MGKSKVKTNLRYIGSGLFYVIAGLLVLFILFELILPKQTVKVFQFKPYVVLTESMEPVINVNDMVIVTNPTNKKLDNLKIGDIITFEADIDGNETKEVVTHYVNSIVTISEDERIIRTNRYGTTVPDTWILTDDDILGIYAFKIPQLGMVSKFITSGYGIAAISVNVLIIGAIIYIVKTSKKKEEVKEEVKKEA